MKYTFVRLPCKGCGKPVPQTVEYPEPLCVRCMVGLQSPEMRTVMEEMLAMFGIKESDDPGDRK